MRKEVTNIELITYHGNCPVCNKEQTSRKRPEDVDYICFECSVAERAATAKTTVMGATVVDVKTSDEGFLISMMLEDDAGDRYKLTSMG